MYGGSLKDAQEPEEMWVSHPYCSSLTLGHCESFLKRDGKLTAWEAGVGHDVEHKGR